MGKRSKRRETLLELEKQHYKKKQKLKIEPPYFCPVCMTKTLYARALLKIISEDIGVKNMVLENESAIVMDFRSQNNKDENNKELLLLWLIPICLFAGVILQIIFMDNKPLYILGTVFSWLGVIFTVVNLVKYLRSRQHKSLKNAENLIQDA